MQLLSETEIETVGGGNAAVLEILRGIAGNIIYDTMKAVWAARVSGQATGTTDILETGQVLYVAA